MILVVFGHAWDGLFKANQFTSTATFEQVYDWIYFFHMPVLFFISGMLFFRAEGAKRALIEQLLLISSRMMYPLLVWSYLHFLAKYFAGDLVNEPVDAITVLSAPFPPKDIFWFIWALFIIQISSTLILGVAARSVQLYLSLFLAALALAVGSVRLLEWSPWYSFAILNTHYFFAGGLLSTIKVPTTSGTGLIILSGLAFLACPTVYILSDVSSTSIGLAAEFSLRYSCILALFFWFNFASTQRVTFLLISKLSVLGQASLSIYLLHLYFTFGSRIFLNSLGVSSSLAHLTIACVTGSLAPAAIYFLARKQGIAALLGLGR